jgi:hypothetical protein
MKGKQDLGKDLEEELTLEAGLVTAISFIRVLLSICLGPTM